jgi:hypothetical protein
MVSQWRDDSYPSIKIVPVKSGVAAAVAEGCEGDGIVTPNEASSSSSSHMFGPLQPRRHSDGIATSLGRRAALVAVDVPRGRAQEDQRRVPARRRQHRRGREAGGGRAPRDGGRRHSRSCAGAISPWTRRPVARMTSGTRAMGTVRVAAPGGRGPQARRRRRGRRQRRGLAVRVRRRRPRRGVRQRGPADGRAGERPAARGSSSHVHVIRPARTGPGDAPPSSPEGVAGSDRRARRRPRRSIR